MTICWVHLISPHNKPIIDHPYFYKLNKNTSQQLNILSDLKTHVLFTPHLHIVLLLNIYEVFIMYRHSVKCFTWNTSLLPHNNLYKDDVIIIILLSPQLRSDRTKNQIQPTWFYMFLPRTLSLSLSSISSQQNMEEWVIASGKANWYQGLPWSFSRWYPCLPVQGRAGGHTPPKPSDPHLTEIWNAREVGSNDGQGVRRAHKEAILAQDHITILWERMYEDNQTEATATSNPFP